MRTATPLPAAALLLSALAVAALMAPSATALRVGPEIVVSDIGGECNHTGMLCEYWDCHDTMPECDRSTCEFYFHGNCYYDFPIND